MKSLKLNPIRLLPGLALVLLLAGPLTLALAQDSPTAPAPGAREAKAQLLAEYRQKVEPLQDQLWAKEVEVEALSRAGNLPELRAAAAEAVKLRAQIREERRKLADKGWVGGRGLGHSKHGSHSKTWSGSHRLGQGRPGPNCPCQ